MTTATSGPLLANPSPKFFGQDSRVIGLQLYTLGDLPGEDLDGVLEQVATIGYRDLELPGLYGLTPSAVKASADRSGVRISSLHMAPAPGLSRDPLTLQDGIGEIADCLGALGITQVVVPMAPLPPGFQRPGLGGDMLQALSRSFADAGVDYWKKFTALLNDRALALKSAGISLGYHNHNFEFAPIGTTSGWEILVRETEPDLISFEIDTGWLGAAGIDPAAFLQRHRGRVRWLHVKDLKPSTAVNYALFMDPVEVGDGKLDWAGILPAASEAGVRHFYVEQEPPFAMPRMEAVTRSYTYLSQCCVGS